MTDRTLSLPSSPDAAAEAAAVLREHLPGDEEFIRHSWRWAEAVTGDRAEAEHTYWATLDAAGVDPSPEDDQESADAAPQPPGSASDGPHAGDPPADLEARIKTADPYDGDPIPRWNPDREPVLCGTLVLTEWLDGRGRDGPLRVLVINSADGNLTEVFCSWVNLRAGLRHAELTHGRPIQRGDRVALRFTHSERAPRARQPSRRFAIEIDWQ